MLRDTLRLTRPGLFVTATDTEVGKTVVSCAICAALRRQWAGGGRVGVCKPMASGCRREREGLVNEDAEALAHFADCRQPLDVINPIRFAPPLAPAVAAEQTRQAVDWSALERSLEVLDATSDVMVIEGVGGLLVPLDPQTPQGTVLDLIQVLGYPVVVVCRSTLGTLNHTAMTVRLLKDAGARVAGLVMNNFEGDTAVADDPSIATNRVWLSRLTGADVLAVVPRVSSEKVRPHAGVIDAAVLEAVGRVDWVEMVGVRC